jgi:hypothetical protein
MPGRKAVWRVGNFEKDIIGIDDESQLGESMLAPLMRSGNRLNHAVSLASIRARAQSSLASLPEPWRQLAAPTPYPVEITDALSALSDETRDDIERENA